jgi:hypothetical protein
MPAAVQSSAVVLLSTSQPKTNWAMMDPCDEKIDSRKP